VAGEERPIAPLWALFALGLVAGAPYLGGGPVWDDHRLIVGHLSGLDATGVFALWTEPVGLGEAGASYYRPLAMSLLALVAPLGFVALHLLNAALHGASGALLYHLGGRRPWALLGALFFLFHPVANEILGWASALPDALSLCLGLASVALAGRSLVGAALLLLLSGLSKETGLLVLPAGILAGMAPRAAWVAVGAAGIGLLGLRLGVGAGAAWQLADKAGLAPMALASTWSGLVLPFPFGAVRDLLALPAWLLPVGIGVFGLLTLAARKSPTGAGGLFLIAMGPIFSLGPMLSGNLGAHRYGYVAAAGIALLVGGARVALRTSLIVQVGMLGFVMQLVLAPQWKDDLILFGTATRGLPGSSYAWHFLGGARLQQGDHAGAAEAFVAAVQTGHPHPADASYALVALEQSGQSAAAVAWGIAQQQRGFDATALAHWARAAEATGQRPMARELLEQLQRADGGYEGPDWVPAFAQRLAAP
jgi:hypothetical protein